MGVGEWIRGKLRPAADITTYTKNFSTHRWGQSYSEDSMMKAVRRNMVLKFLGDRIYDLAFDDGFQIEDKKTEERVDPLSDEIEKLRWESVLALAAKKECQFGAVSLVLFEDYNEEGSYSLLKSFRPARTSLNFHENGQISEYIFEEYLNSVSTPLTFKIEDPEEMENVFHIVLRPHYDYPYRGQSKLEPVWDVAHGHQIILESAMVCSARVAYGIRKATIMDRGDPTKNTALANAVEEGMKDLEAGDTSIILWGGYTDKGGTFQDTLEIDTGSIDFNYTEKLDIYHKSLAFITGIPKNFWDGIFQGSLVGAEVVKQMLDSSLKELREEWTQIIEDIIKRWCELNNMEWKDTYHVVWKLEQDLSEREKKELENIEANTDSILINTGIMDVPEIREKRGLKDPNKEIIPPSQFNIDVKGLDSEGEEENEEDNSE
jgi:hypothetical protein